MEVEVSSAQELLPPSHAPALAPGNDTRAPSALSSPSRASLSDAGLARTVDQTFVTAACTAEEIVHLLLAGEQAVTFSRVYRVTKRMLDVLVAGIGLVICTPFIMLICLLIWLDSRAPALFLQPRVGYRGRTFLMVKFRTMAPDSTVQLGAHPHKQRHDARITRIGRFLRATSLDELPQLINVLRGEMSLVGPRPELIEIVRTKYELWQYQRLLVPQGMTGWWQVTGRANKLCHQHTADDLFYIAHASLRFDLKILLMTVRAVVTREGAY